jgi:tetratricopeptide (TPR) repeat protein
MKPAATAALLAAALLAAALGCGNATTSKTSAAPAASPKIILIGVDAGDWLAIDPLIRAGRLPTFARIKALGRTGIMTSTPPLVSPIIWTTLATGVEVENHGILDFMVDGPDGRQQPVGSAFRRAPALWNLFSSAGRSVAIIGWWATWPAEHVRGTIVSDAVAPQLTRSASRPDAGLVWPADREALVRAKLTPVTAIQRADITRYASAPDAEIDRALAAARQPGDGLYRDPLAHLAAVIAGSRTYASLAMELVRSDRPDLLAIYLEEVDTVSHVFVADSARGPSAIARAYEDVDALLRSLAEASPPDTLMIVCSDHGFYPPTAGIRESPSDLTGPATAWHRPYGIVAAATAGTLAGGQPSPLLGPTDIGSITPVDLAPTVLHGAGLAVATDMPGRVITSLLPSDAASRPVVRSVTAGYSPPAAIARRDGAEALERLQALGYVGTAKTSLARQNLAESLFRRGKYDAAERELRALVEAQPRNVPARLWLAQTLAHQGRPAEALRVYEETVALPGGARESLVPAIDLAISTDNFDAARRMLATAGIPAPERLTAAGALAEARHDERDAERSYRAALKLDPLSFDAASRLFDLLNRTGRAADAEAPLARAATLAPDSARHLALIGNLRIALHDPAGAEIALSRAMELSPGSAAVQQALGRALLMQQKRADAIRTLQAIPPSRDRDTLLGAAYSGEQNWASAITHLQAALDAGPPTPELLNALGWAEMQAGRRDVAAATFGRSLQLRANQPEIRKLLSQLPAASRTGR